MNLSNESRKDSVAPDISGGSRKMSGRLLQEMGGCPKGVQGVHAIAL